MAKTILEMRNITKTFPGVKALDNVNLQVEEGENHALVGENGAGKSTLMNVLSGIYPYGSYEGDIIYQGEVCQLVSFVCQILRKERGPCLDSISQAILALSSSSSRQ